MPQNLASHERIQRWGHTLARVSAVAILPAAQHVPELMVKEASVGGASESVASHERPQRATSAAV